MFVILSAILTLTQNYAHFCSRFIQQNIDTRLQEYINLYSIGTQPH